jgi:hypothetical protein
LLSNYPFSISYGASDDRLGDFYIPALERAVSFDRTTGFFSSASLASPPPASPAWSRTAARCGSCAVPS